MKETTPTTLQVIADAIHVSRSTVSRVLNNKWKKFGISQITADKIISQAKKLHYIKNVGAQSLRAKKTFIIGVIVRDITNPFYSPMFVLMALMAFAWLWLQQGITHDLIDRNPRYSLEFALMFVLTLTLPASYCVYHLSRLPPWIPPQRDK